MSTPRQILSAAYTTSKANKGSSDIDEATEGLSLVKRALDRLYVLTARVRPEYFAEKIQVGIVNGAWPLPSNAESVFRIEKIDGTEVVALPYTERALHSGRKPAVYFFGRQYFSGGNPTDPSAGNLVLFCAKTPPALTIDGELSAAIWPQQHDSLLVGEAAVTLSLKDRRVGEDLPQLKKDRDRAALLWVAHLEHVNAAELRRTGVIQRFPSQFIPDLLAVLAGNELTAGG